MKKSFPQKTTAAKPVKTKKTVSAQPPKKVAPLKKSALKKPAAKAVHTVRKKRLAGNRETVMTSLIIKALEDLKGKDIVTLDVKHLTDVMDTMVVVSGTSNRHVKSLADHARMELKQAGYLHYGMEGEDAGEWVLVDFGGVVLHVMQPHIREFYDLESLWSTPQVNNS